MRIAAYEALRPLAGVGIGQSFVCREGEQPAVAVTILPAAVLQAGPSSLSLSGVLKELALRLLEVDKRESPEAYRLEPQADGSALWITPFGAGTTLDTLFRERGNGALAGASIIFGRIAALLARAHRAGIHHLRLAPQQIVVDSAADPQQLQVSLLGLGLVGVLGSLVPPGGAAGAVYVAPELREGRPPSAENGAACDVYSLGVILVEALCGQAPEGADVAAALLHADSQIPADYSALALRMLQSDARARPTAIEVARGLRQGSPSTPSEDWHQKLAGHMLTVAAPPRSGERAALAVTESATSRPSSVSGAAAGMRFGNFRLIRPIGEGGMGVVYEAEHCQIGRRAAVKILHPEFAEDSEQAQRFLNEARAVNIIRHPGLVEIFEQGQMPDGTLYIVMEFLDGQSLRQWLSGKDQNQSAAAAPRIGLQLARALAASHEKGIIHRDLKPENIMLVADPVRPEEVRAKILDFGIAKLQRRSTPGAPSRGVKTEAGAVLGTVQYMAPEQFGQAESVDGAADVFALGVILYELTTGVMPYAGNSLKLLSTRLVPVRSRNRAVVRRLAALIERMLTLSESERPSMAQVAAELARLEPLPARRSRSLRQILIGGGLGSLLLGGGYVALHRPSQLSYSQARALARSTLQAGVHARGLDERSEAVTALGKSRDPAQSSLLEPLLQESQLVAVAARALGNIGAVSAQSQLLRIVENAPDERARIEAATALLQLSHPKGSAVLRELLRSSDSLTQIEAALRLLEHADQSGAPFLRRLIDTSSTPPERIIPVLATLARFGDAQAHKRLEQMGTTSSLAGDPLLLYSLARLGAQKAREQLRRSSQSGPQTVLATRLLVSLGECPAPAQQQLLATLSDGKQPDAARQIAIEGIADCEVEEAVLPLAHVITEPGSHRLSFAAAAAVLRLFAGQRAHVAERSLAWSHMALGSDSGATRQMAVELLGVVDGEGSIPPLRQALRDRERDVRRGAAQALGKKQVRTALQALVDSLSDSDGEVRSAGMRSIGQVVGGLRRRGDGQADKLVLGPLAALAQSQDAADRIVASGVLVQLGQAGHSNELRAAAASESPLLRRLAIEQLAEPGLLQQALADRDATVRFAAAKRLALRGQAEAVPVLREFLSAPGLDGVLAYGLLRKLGESPAEPSNLVSRVMLSNSSERAVVLGLIPHLPQALAQQLLLALSGDEQASARLRVAVLAHEMFEKTGAPPFRDMLLGMRDDTNLAVQLAIAQLLAREPAAEAPRTAAATEREPRPTTSADDLGTRDGAASNAVASAAPRSSGATEPSGPAPGAAPDDVATKVQLLLNEARAALAHKQYEQALRHLERARRQLGRSGRSALLGEVLFLSGTAHELRGQWREAMDAYLQFERLSPAQRSKEAAAGVLEATARLKKKMGQIQIFTLRDGQCVQTDSYYLPAGEHIISLGHGAARTASVEAGLVTAIRQCP